MLQSASQLPALSSFCACVRDCPSQNVLFFSRRQDPLKWLFHFDHGSREIVLLFDLHIVRQTSIWVEPVFLKKVLGEYQPSRVSSDQTLFGHSGFNVQFKVNLAGSADVLGSVERDFDKIVQVAGKWTLAGVLKLLSGNQTRSLSFSPNPVDLLCCLRTGTS